MIKALLLILVCLFAALGNAQNMLHLTLEETIVRAQQHSPDAQTARHRFRSEYWNYQYHLANYLPSITLTSDPSLNRAINKVTLSDGTVKFVEQNMLNSNLALSITQNIPWTGGTLFVETEVQRMDMFDNKSISWQTSPVNIGYSQSLFGYNSLKWSRRIEPIRFLEAKKKYMETQELVASGTVDKFFALAIAQSNYETACFNYANADTLYQYAQGRYRIGTITENEMLQLELNKLSEETNQINAHIEVENCIQNLRSYLGIQEEIELKALIKDSVPDFFIELNEALLKAKENSPDIQNMVLRKLESESNVAQAKANAGLKADIYVRFGLTQTADKLRNAYKNPLEQQYIKLGISLPILDWGRGKGSVRVARSRRDLVYTQVEQSQTDFELNIRKLVKQFNLQAQRVKIASRTNETAQKRNEVARRLYILGKSTILDLNASITEKDNARRSYVNALYKFWSLYYTLRSITLHDFEHQRELTINIDELQ